MRKLLICLAAVGLFCTVARAADDQAVKDRLNDFQSAWNKDDAKAMAAIWVEDGSLINPFGKTAHSRGEIEKIFADEHAQMFKGSTYKSGELKVQWVTPDVAVVDLEGTISGVHGSDGAEAPDYPHHVTWVFVKKDGKWMAAAARAYQLSAPPTETK